MLPECFKSGSIARVDFEKLVQTTDLEDVQYFSAHTNQLDLSA